MNTNALPERGAQFDRVELLLGQPTMERLAAVRVIIFGVGGVGSWCAESLIRSGVGHLTIVDSDCVCISNVGRQAMATTCTVGQPKVDALRDRLLQINPQADIEARQERFCAETAEDFHLEQYDYVIDCIDSLQDKLELILQTTSRPAVFFSSMGAALKLDPTQVRVSEFWQVDGCPLAATLRRRMRRQKRFPGRKFQCVWSPEVLPNLGTPSDQPRQGADLRKARVNGSLAHITAIYGFTLAGLVMRDVHRKQL